MWYWIWAFIGALSAITAEAIYRKHEGPFEQIAPIAIILGCIITYGVFSVMRLSTTLLGGIIIWSGFTATLRIFTTIYIVKEQPTPATWVAFGCIVAAQVITKLWR